MTILESPRNNYPTAEYGASGKVYSYDLKLEVNVPEGAKTVAIPAIFLDLAKKMTAAAGSSCIIADTTGKTFIIATPPKGDEFSKAFCVEQTQGKGGKARKVMLGFKLRSTTPMSTIKSRTMNYLSEKNLFIRMHHGGFEHGVHQAFLGYFQGEHPRDADLELWRAHLVTAMTDYWNDETLWIDDERKRFLAHNANFVTDSEVNFPLIISKQRLISTHDEKKIITDGIQATTPVAQAPAVMQLLDGALANKRTLITDFIPSGLRREDPGLYHGLLNAHAKFMHHHRKIQLTDITASHLDMDVDGTSLREHIMAKAPAVQALRHDPHTNRIHITTNKDHFPALCQWIDNELLAKPFPFRMTRVLPARTHRTTSSNTAKYASMFSDQHSVVTQESFDASTISRNTAWTKSPPLAIEYSYDLSTTAFPPLSPLPKQSVDTQSTAPSTLADETAFTSAIELAIKRTEQDFQAQLAKMQTEIDQRLASLEKTMESMVANIIKQTYESLTGTNSPFASKLDHANLQADVNSISTKMDSVLTLLHAQASNNTSPIRDIHKRPRDYNTPPRTTPPSQPTPDATVMTTEPISATTTMTTATNLTSHPLDSNDEIMEGSEE